MSTSQLNALFKVTYGVYIVSCKKDDKLNGCIATTVCQVTATPPAISIAINKENMSHDIIKETMKFGVSVLRKDTDFKFIGQFGFKSGRNFDKFEGVNYKIGNTGVPLVIDNAIACFEIKVGTTLDVGTHTIFVGEVVDASILSQEEPLTYAHYHEVKGGKSPKTAPTYIANK